VECQDPEPKIFEHECVYKSTIYDTKQSSRAVAIVDLRGTLLNDVYDYLQVAKDPTISSICSCDEETLKAVTAVAVRRDFVSEKWDSVDRSYHIVVQATIVRSEAIERIAGILRDSAFTAECVKVWNTVFNAQGIVGKLREEFYKHNYQDAELQEKYHRQAVQILLEEFLTRGLNAYIDEIYDLAIQCFKRAILLDSSLLQPHDYLCNVYSTQRNYVKLLASCRACIKLDPTFVKAYKTMGDVYMKQAKYREALHFYHKTSSLDSSNPLIYVEIGKAYAMLREYQQAVKSVQETLSRCPYEENALVAMGEIYATQGNRKTAMQYYQEAANLGDKRAKKWLKPFSRGGRGGGR
jgi:tetratricopeptide (TPR) repeat protein